MSLDARSSSALFKRAEQLKRWEESETNRESSDFRGNTRKVKFPSGCVFLAVCAASDKEEVLKHLKKGADIDTANADGLSALHQACIEDNLDMVEFLVEHGADVNKGDNEGWTPLHATASCGFMSIAKYLIEHGANVAAVNNDGELPQDIAESDEMEDMLIQQIEDRGINAEDARKEEERLMLIDANNWLLNGVEEKVHPKTGATALHVATAKGYIEVMDKLLQAGANVNAQDFDGWTPLHAAAHWGQREACEILVEHLCDMEIKNCVGQTALDVAETEILRLLEDLKVKQASMSRDHIINKTQNNNELKSPVQKEAVMNDTIKIENEDVRQKVAELPKVEVEIKPIPSENESRVEKKNRANRDDSERLAKIVEPQVPNKTVPINAAPTAPPSKQGTVELDTNVPSWRRAGSVRSKETPKPHLTLILKEKESPKSSPGINTAARSETAHEVVLRRTQSFEADEKFYRRYLELRAKIDAGGLHSAPARSASLKEKHYVRRGQPKEEVRVSGAVSAGGTPTSTSSPLPTSPTSSSQQQPNNVRRSFVPPVRDEESETQRKAHAKRVRETRRCTQGVTLEELKSAEQLVKKKQQQQLQQQAVGSHTNNSDQFMLEDARTSMPEQDVGIVKRAVATPVTETGDTTVTLPLRRNRMDDKVQDKENDTKTAQATQAVIQRRKRPKRRSTGVPLVDMDEIDPDRNSDSVGGGGYSSNRDSEEIHGMVNSTESGADKSGRSSRLDSSVDNEPKQAASPTTPENGEIDYKKLYEESLLENDRLREKLRHVEEDLAVAKSQADKNTLLHKNSLSELEKRERRAMERKLSEMEEELKQLQKLKADNEKLRAENRALTRVVSNITATNDKCN